MPKPRKEPDQSRYSGRLAKRLRTLRDAAGVDIDDLAEKLTKAGYPVSTPTLYAWESGRLQIQLDALPYLAKALKVKVSDLLPEK
jgi:transcriptional regulator with XRE-family HTH domain